MATDYKAVADVLLADMLLADGLADSPLGMLDAVLLDFSRLLSGETDLADWSESEKDDAALAVAQGRAVVGRVMDLLREDQERLTACDRAKTRTTTDEERENLPF